MASFRAITLLSLTLALSICCATAVPATEVVEDLVELARVIDHLRELAEQSYERTLGRLIKRGQREHYSFRIETSCRARGGATPV